MKLLRYISLFVIVIGFYSCEKNLTELDNIGVQTSAVYFNDPENAKAGLNACYNPLTDDHFFVYGDILSDDAIKGGSNYFDWVDRQELRDFNAKADNGVTGQTWKLCYKTIVRCNEIINSLEDATFDLAPRMIGEAKFLRAMAYTRLVPLFGGVPLITIDLGVDELNQTRATVAEVYALIKQDLDDAIAVLPKRSQYQGADLGRATKGAARTLKAWALMLESTSAYNTIVGAATGHTPNTNEIWDEVYNQTTAIINSGEYSLVANYAEIFEDEGENGVESIFEWQHETTENAWGESVGNKTIVQMGNRDAWGWCFNCPTDDLFYAYGTTDPRRECTIYGQDGLNVLYGVSQIWDKQEWTLTDESTTDFVTACRLNRKYALRPSMREAKHNNQSVNKRVFRYSEVLLMHAEAAYYKGLEGEALTYVNMVRARAERATLPYGAAESQTEGFTFDLYSGADVPAIAAGGTDLLEAIWKERRLELALEGKRYFDLIRTGRTDLLPGSANYANHDGLMPIPIGDVNSFGVTQNKGY